MNEDAKIQLPPNFEVASSKSYLEEVIEKILSGNVSASVIVVNSENPTGATLTRTEYYGKLFISLRGKMHPKYQEVMDKLVAMDVEDEARIKKINEEYLKRKSEEISAEDKEKIQKLVEVTGQKLPSMAEMSKNALAAIVRTADQFVSHGVVKAAPEEIERRRIICSGDGGSTPRCDKFILENERCGVCGCFTKLKTWLTAERCPLGKW